MTEFFAAIVGALVGGGATLLGGYFQGKQAESAAVKRESRDSARLRAEAVATAQREAAQRVMSGLETMCGLWTDPERPLDLTQRAERSSRLWTLHEEVRVQALTLPGSLREGVTLATRILRFAGEIGGDEVQSDGFIFLGERTVAQVTYEAIYEQLARFIAGDQPLPWPDDALRVAAAHEELMKVRAEVYAAEQYEYDSDREAFDASHSQMPRALAASRWAREAK